MKPAPRPTLSADDSWREVCAARIPAIHATALAPVRDQSDVRVFRTGADFWVRWTAGRGDVLRCLLPVPGVAFFLARSGRWYRFGSRLPTSDIPPDGEGEPVAALIGPEKIEPVSPGSTSFAPVVLSIVRGGGPHVATALACDIAGLRRWAETATTAELAAVQAACSGSRALLLGTKLPAVPHATRHWGDDLLVPVGYRPEPDLAPAILRGAVGAGADDLVALDERGAEIIPRSAFEPLTRAGIRLLLAEVAP
jgi:hypothetical protein